MKDLDVRANKLGVSRYAALRDIVGEAAADFAFRVIEVRNWDTLSGAKKSMTVVSATLLKAKRRYNVGEVSTKTGLKKVAPGKWAPVSGDKVPKGKPKPKAVRTKAEWKQFATLGDAKKAALEVSAKNPGKYVTMSVVFDTVSFDTHNTLPQSDYAPGDWAHGYALNGKWKSWSDRRVVRYKEKMLEGEGGMDR